MREVVVLKDILSEWVVLDHEDGTAQLINRRYGSLHYYRATRHTLASHVRDAMAERGIPADAWPECP